MTCTCKHTAYQVSDEEWKCPKCGATAEEGFVIMDTPNFDCEKYHDDDEIECERCGYCIDGKSFARAVHKKKGLVKCPCCKGKGVVKKSVAEKMKEKKK